MRLPEIRAASLIIAFMIALPSWADFEAGQRALDAGRISEALRQWHLAADARDPRAMAGLGRLYRQGVGVLQD